MRIAPTASGGAGAATAAFGVAGPGAGRSGALPHPAAFKASRAETVTACARRKSGFLGELETDVAASQQALCHVHRARIVSGA